MYREKRDRIFITEIVVLAVIVIFGIVSVCTVCCGYGYIKGKIGTLINENSDIPEPVIDTSLFVDNDTKNNKDLVIWAENAYENEWGYVYGTWGNKLTQSLYQQKAAQYPESVGAYDEFISSHYVGKRVTDCIGLIKGYGWLTGDNEFIYCSNGMPDVGADRLFNEAEEKGEIETIPEIPGLAVWAKGHIGVYVGDGWVIDAMGTVDGMKKTRIEDRAWTHWCKIPYIEYI